VNQFKEVYTPLDRWELESINLKQQARVNLVSRTVRNINRILIREKDLGRLLQKVCDKLVETNCYQKVWMVLVDESRNAVESAIAGLGIDLTPLSRALQNSSLPFCIQSALEQPHVTTIENPTSTCSGCSLSTKHADMGAMSARLAYNGKTYGVLATCIPKEIMYDLSEQRIFNEIAEDIAFGLRTRILEKEKWETEKSLKNSTTRLHERLKELNFFFSFSNLLEKPNITLEGIIQGAVDLLPSAFQYPDITGARITLKGREFKTGNFKTSEWKLVTKINTSSYLPSTLEVCYLEEPPYRDDGPFLKEEKHLIDSIAERIGKVYARMRAEKALIKSERQFRNFVDNSVTGISIIQNGNVIYQNPEQERLLGPLPRRFQLTADDEIHPDDASKVKEFYRKLLTGKSKILDTDFRIYPSNQPRTPENMKWVLCRANHIEYLGEGAILINMIDVTRTKELEHLIGIQDKMSSLGHVAAGIAHEIRNPLSGFNIYLKTLEKIYGKGGSDEKVEKIFKQLQSASNKIESVIKRVMDFSKPSEPKFTFIDINQPVEEAVDLSSVTMRKRGIQIQKDLARDLPKCHADLQMIEQVILNLITNAAEAMKGTDGPKEMEISSFAEKGFVGIKVCDSGPGIPVISKDKIFDPFYTTKSDSSGIGLSICHRIITDHKGSLEVSESKLGGAEFTLKIPLNKGAE